LTIELGSWGANQASFTAKPGSPAVTLTIAADATLDDVRDAINASGAGVVASVVTDATGARLAIRSRDTGEANAFRISAADDDGDDADAAGLSALAYDPSAGVTSMSRKQPAANARASINGVDIVSASNTLPDVIDGLTLQLGQLSATPVDVAVTANTESIRKAITDFATAYNDLNTATRKLTSYDATSKTGGALQGDRAVVGLQQQLRQLIGGTSGASTLYTRLADIGLEPQRDGSLKVGAGKLDSAIAKLDELRKVFANGDLLTPANDGFAMAIRRYADGALGFDGSLSTHKQGLTDRIERNSDQQARLEDRMTDIEKRMRSQYTALDRQMAQLNSLSDYVAQQVKILGNSNNSD
jgi:flagellar hook-associated protein 2